MRAGRRGVGAATPTALVGSPCSLSSVGRRDRPEERPQPTGAGHPLGLRRAGRRGGERGPRGLREEAAPRKAWLAGTWQDSPFALTGKPVREQPLASSQCGDSCLRAHRGGHWPVGPAPQPYCSSNKRIRKTAVRIGLPPSVRSGPCTLGMGLGAAPFPRHMAEDGTQIGGFPTPCLRPSAGPRAEVRPLLQQTRVVSSAPVDHPARQAPPHPRSPFISLSLRALMDRSFRYSLFN